MTNGKWWKLVVAAVLTLIFCYLGSVFWQEAKVESFLRDPGPFGNVKKVTFTGQGRKVIVDDPESIAALNKGLQQSAYCPDVDPSGTVYMAQLEFANGATLDVRVTIHDKSKMTFSQGDPPKWRTLEVPAIQPQPLRDAIHRLLFKREMPPTSFRSSA